MRIRGEILAVQTTGDQLLVRMQGTGDADGEWRPVNVITFECADTTANKRALYVGRRLVVEIRAV